MEAILHFHKFCGQKTTGICEGFHSSAKAAFDARGSRKHTWRLDQLIWMLLNDVLDAFRRKSLDRFAGMLMTL